MGQNQWYHFGAGEFTTHFGSYFSGWIESDVHWGLTDLAFDKPMASCREGWGCRQLHRLVVRGGQQQRLVPGEAHAAYGAAVALRQTSAIEAVPGRSQTGATVESKKAR